MAFHNPFTDEEMNAAATVQMSDEILTHALRIGTEALVNFADQQMRPTVDTLIAPSDRDRAIGMLFYRLLAALKTSTKLTEPYEFQATAGTTRTIFELSADLLILTDNLIPDAVEKFHAFTRAARFSAAYTWMKFFEAHPELKAEMRLQHRERLVNQPGLENEITTLCKRLWNTTKAPPHWSGLRWSEQAELLPLNVQAEYVRWHQLWAWEVHGGGAGVGGVGARAFMAIETTSRQTIQAVVPGAFRKIGVELHIHRADSTFFDYLDFLVTKVETLAAIDAQLQSLGRPPKFA